MANRHRSPENLHQRQRLHRLRAGVSAHRRFRPLPDDPSGSGQRVRLQRMSITTEQWQKIEENLTTSIASVKFQMESDAITVTRVRIKENRLALAVYINDEIVWKHGMESDEQPELIRKVWRKRTVAAYSPVKKQKIIKSFGKRRAKELFPSLDKVTTYYD